MAALPDVPPGDTTGMCVTSLPPLFCARDASEMRMHCRALCALHCQACVGPQAKLRAGVLHALCSATPGGTLASWGAEVLLDPALHVRSLRMADLSVHVRTLTEDPDRLCNYLMCVFSAPALAQELPPRALAALLADAHAPFALAAGPLVRILLLRLGPQDHLLALTLHHAVADGWSLRVRCS